MDSVLVELKISDPTAEAAEDEIMADGVTSQAAEQKMRQEEIKKEKKDKREKKKEKKEKKRAIVADDGVSSPTHDDDAMDIDGGVPLRIKEKKHKKDKE